MNGRVSVSGLQVKRLARWLYGLMTILVDDNMGLSELGFQDEKEVGLAV